MNPSDQNENMLEEEEEEEEGGGGARGCHSAIRSTAVLQNGEREKDRDRANASGLMKHGGG